MEVNTALLRVDYHELEEPVTLGDRDMEDNTQSKIPT